MQKKQLIKLAYEERVMDLQKEAANGQNIEFMFIIKREAFGLPPLPSGDKLN